jgi:hypothetical protein
MKRIAIFGPLVGALALVGALSASADHSQRTLAGTRAVPVPTLPPPGDFGRVARGSAAKARGREESTARGLSVSVPYGSFDGALVTKEWAPLERAVVENKYYARGVGNVRTVMVKGGSEEENLVSVTTGG